jgi:hypothetical protein
MLYTLNEVMQYINYHIQVLKSVIKKHEYILFILSERQNKIRLGLLKIMLYFQSDYWYHVYLTYFLVQEI